MGRVWARVSLALAPALAPSMDGARNGSSYLHHIDIGLIKGIEILPIEACDPFTIFGMDSSHSA